MINPLAYPLYSSQIPIIKLRPIKYTATFIFGLTSLLACGCHDRTADFKPTNDVAENALMRGLEDWRAGKLAGEISGSKPAIHVSDTARNPKQTLESFKILGETPGRSGRTFAVELSLKHPDEKLKTEYIVVGIDPLWIFRREDFELLMHWDHRMPKLPKETNASVKE